MFLVQRDTGHLVEVLDVKQLFDPFEKEFKGRLSVGEDLPDPEMFKKTDVLFQSGESLPRCWLDEHYRDDEVVARP
ncbi:MAG TPA: acetyltransferase [Chromatiales bacterium]|nr:acetyltransferase [Thiotrichales bacterium]HIP68940.1 acetyltransferase [Chromatiales bacterium]